MLTNTHRRVHTSTRARFSHRIAILLACIVAAAPMVAIAMTENHFPVPSTCPIHQGSGITGAAILPDGTIYLPCGQGLLKIVYNPPAAPVETYMSQIGGIAITATDAAFDSNGILWLAGGNKLIRVDIGTNVAQSYPLAPTQGTASRLLIGADNNIWYLNNGSAPFGRFDPATTTVTVLQSPSAARLTDFALAPDGHVWYGSYDYAVGEVLPDNSIREWIVTGSNYTPSLVFDAAGQLWGSLSGSVARWVNNDWQVVPAPIPASASYAFGLTLAPDGVVWQFGFVRSSDNNPDLMRWMFGTVAPDGTQTQTSLAAPGSGGLIAWARFRPNDNGLFFFDRNGTVNPYGLVQPYSRTTSNTTVTEFYNTILNHYFITANLEEAAGIDAGTAGPGWSRTAKSFKAWLDGPIPAASEVCRFYGTPGRGPNSHFYTANSAECVLVKQDAGWTYEALGRFWLVRPTTNTPAGCPTGTQAIYRTYNNRFPQNDSNHRYTTELEVYNQMLSLGWLGEGVVMCAPS
jgi:streptogramin lyase